jgi:hypothetical protein
MNIGRIYVISISTFFGNLFGGTSKLSALEKMILDTVRSQLTEGIVLLWDRQIQAINKIQRLPDGLEVNFYRMKNGCPTFDAELAFPNNTEELQVAVVYVTDLRTSSKIAASIWCINGFLFSIEYDVAAKYFADVIAMEAQPNLVADCQMMVDLEGRRAD